MPAKKSITDGKTLATFVDGPTIRALRAHAQKEGISLSKTVRQMLSLGLMYYHHEKAAKTLKDNAKKGGGR